MIPSPNSWCSVRAIGEANFRATSTAHVEAPGACSAEFLFEKTPLRDAGRQSLAAINERTAKLCSWSRRSNRSSHAATLLFCLT